ncbi:MAG: hypothetical protein FWG90_07120 [Oscillospiraceae bacterium]|nr:hypothetical protein [Oscillospiraceae bacterium]
MPKFFMFFYALAAEFLGHPALRIFTSAFLIVGGVILIADFLKLYNVRQEDVRNIALVFQIIGALLIIGGIIFLIDFNLIKIGAEKNIGEITKIYHNNKNYITDGNMNGSYKVSVQIDGEEHTRNLYWGLKPKQAVGDSITVYNIPGKPSRLYSSDNNEEIRLIFFGMLFFVPGFIAMRSMRSRRKKEAGSLDTLVELAKINPDLISKTTLNQHRGALGTSKDTSDFKKSSQDW